MNEKLRELARLATDAGAQGVWVIRGARVAGLAFSFEELNAYDCNVDPPLQMLQLSEPHQTIVLMRFPGSDGGESGIEHSAG